MDQDHAESPAMTSARDRLRAYFAEPGFTQAQLVERMVDGALACEEMIDQQRRKIASLEAALKTQGNRVQAPGSAHALVKAQPSSLSANGTQIEHMRSVKLGQLEVQIGKAQAQLNRIHQQEADAKQQLQRAQRDLEQIETRKVKATREFQAKEAASVELAGKLSTAKQVVDDLAYQRECLDASVTATRNRLADLNQQVANAQKELHKAAVKTENLEEKIRSAEELRQQIKQDIAVLQETQQQLEQDVSALQQRQQQSERELETLQGKKEAAESEWRALDNSVIAANSRKVEAERDMAEKIKEQQAAGDKLQALLVQHEAMLEDLRASAEKKEKVDQQVHTATAQLENRKTELQSLQEQLQELQQKITAAQQQLANLQQSAGPTNTQPQQKQGVQAADVEAVQALECKVEDLQHAAVAAAEGRSTVAAVAAAAAQQALQAQLGSALKANKQYKEQIEQLKAQLAAAQVAAEDVKLLHLPTPEAADAPATAAAAAGAHPADWLPNPMFHAVEDAGSDEKGFAPLEQPAADVPALCLRLASGSPLPPTAAANVPLPASTDEPNHTARDEEVSEADAGTETAAHRRPARRPKRSNSTGTASMSHDAAAAAEQPVKASRKRRASAAVSHDDAGVSEGTPAAGPGKRRRGSTASFGSDGAAAPGSARRVTRSVSRLESESAGGGSQLSGPGSSVASGTKAKRTARGAAAKVASTLEPIEEEVQSAATTSKAKAAKKAAAKPTGAKGKQQQQAPRWH